MVLHYIYKFAKIEKSDPEGMRVSEFGDYSGLDKSVFMTVDEARKFYGLGYQNSLFATEFNLALESDGIASLDMPVSADDFRAVITSYESCLEECPDLLEQTYHQVDFRHGKDAGQVRKNKKFQNGVQTDDAKNYFHFNEYANSRWKEQFSAGPAVLRQFLREGAEIQAAVVDVAHAKFRELDETHPNISKAHFVGNDTRRVTCTFLRLVSYDSYSASPLMSHEVAKPHYDIGNATIQAYSDAPGFWVSPSGPKGEKRYIYGDVNEGYLFIGYAHKKLYGGQSPLKPLWHGVERIMPPDTTEVPKRHSIVLFIDTPYVNDGVSPAETIPYVFQDRTEVA